MTFGSLSSLCLSVCICIRIHMCIVYTVQSYHNILILAYNMSELSSYISVRARVVPSNQIMRQSKRNASRGILQRLLKVVHLKAADVLFHMSYTTTPFHAIPTFPRPSLPSASSSSSMSGNKGSSCDGGGKEKAT